MNIGVVIQARMSSSRLPRKVMMGIKGKPMLARVIERVKKASYPNVIIVATSNNKADVILRGIADEHGVQFFSLNPENDLLLRYAGAAETFGLTDIVRVTADCPLIDPKIIDYTIESYLRSYQSVASNRPGYPDGFDVEMFSKLTLEYTDTNAVDTYDREHVTPYMEKNFVVNRVARPDLPDVHMAPTVHLSVDTDEDLLLMNRIYEALGDDFTMEEVLDFVGVKDGRV